MYFWRQQLPAGVLGRDRGFGVDWGFTERAGGSSRGVYESLNLADHVGDDPDAVRANRAVVARSLGVPADRLLFTWLKHGADVAVVDDSWSPEQSYQPTLRPVVADTLVTARTDVALGTLVADCVPVLLADAQVGLVAAVHAGRAGLLAGVVEAAVHAMTDLGAHSVHALVGPSVCGRCYEVPAELRDATATRYPTAAAVSWTGTPGIDLGSAVVEALHDLDVAVEWVPGCTRESSSLFSYRRSDRTGRFAGVVRLGAAA